MALADLLARLERTPALSQAGVSEVSEVQPNNGMGFGCNPKETDEVSEVSGSSAAGAPDTPATPVEILGYQAEPLPTLGCTLDTPDTSQNDNGQDVTARAWLLHFADRDPLEVWCSPAVTHAEALADCPDALAAEPLLVERDPPAIARACKHCRRRAQPGHAKPGYCALRTDQPKAYGANHPLHRLPEDGGAGCDLFEGGA